MTSRTGRDGVSVEGSPFMVRILLGSRQRNIRHYRGALTWFATNLEVAAKQGHPFLHAREADPFPRSASVRRLRRLEPAPPVLDLETNSPVQPLEHNVHPGGSRVLAHVR